jgi:type II secretory pathway component PulF
VLPVEWPWLLLGVAAITTGLAVWWTGFLLVPAGGVIVVAVLLRSARRRFLTKRA